MKQFVLFIILLFSSAVYGQSQFQMRYGSQYSDHSHKVRQLHSGSFILVGETKGFAAQSNAFMMKIDTTGDIVWLKVYSGINSDIAYDVIELSDGSLIFCGSTNSFGVGDLDAFVTKTDSDGNVLWSKAYGNFSGDIFYNIAEDVNHGFYVSGLSQMGTDVGLNICQMDNAGNILWSNWVPNDFHIKPAMFTLRDRGVILCGEAVGGGGYLSCWKFSDLGILKWSKKYGRINSGYNASIVEDANTDLFFVGSFSDSNTVSQSVDITLSKIDSAGNYLWAKSYGGVYVEQARTIAMTADSGLIINLITNSTGNGAYDAGLIKLKHDGSLEWAKAYGTNWHEDPSNAVPLSDHGYLLTGITVSSGILSDSNKVHLVKTNSQGNAGCHDVSWSPVIGAQSVSVSTEVASQIITLQTTSFQWNVNSRSFSTVNICNVTGIEESDPENNMTIYPNPATDFILITTHDELKKQVEIINALGEVVYSDDFSEQEYKINLDLNVGFYYVNVKVGGNSFIRKMIVR